jgi:hypothetical protein
VSKPIRAWGAPTHHGKGYACSAQPVLSAEFDEQNATQLLTGDLVNVENGNRHLSLRTGLPDRIHGIGQLALRHIQMMYYKLRYANARFRKVL